MYIAQKCNDFCLLTEDNELLQLENGDWSMCICIYI